MQTAITRSQLGKMALEAAITLERAQKHKSSNMDRVKTFLDALDSEFGQSESASRLRDESMFPYYSYALAKASGEELASRNEFSDAIRHALDKHKSAADREDQLEQVKVFCLAFHEAMVRAIQQHTLGNAPLDGRVR